MKTIITISREFSSGGREIGKRLAEELKFDYYDKKIIDAVAKDCGLDPTYVANCSELPLSNGFNYVFGRSFGSYVESPSDNIQKAQAKVIKKAAEKNCVIIGRCADFILYDQNPFKVFIYSSNMQTKIDRCKDKNINDSDKDIEKEINRINKQRKKYYEYYTGQNWKDIENYNLCIDTSKISIKDAVQLIKQAINHNI